MARGRAYITLAVSCGSMGYCFASLCIWERSKTIPPCQPFPTTASAEGRLIKGGPSLARGAGAKGVAVVSTRMRNILLGACVFYVVLVCLVPTTTWADFDKTIVDLQ